MRLSSLTHDLNVAAVCAGVTAFVWYAFGAMPLFVAVTRQLGPGSAEASSWLFVVWFGGALASIALSVHSRQPIAVASTIPGLVYLGALAGRFTFPEIAGANLMAGVLMVVLGFLGVGARVSAWLPLPIVMGMFAGTLLGYVAQAVKATVEDVAVAGPTVAGYLIARALARRSLPPMALAVAAGALPAFLLRHAAVEPSIALRLPTLVVPEMVFSAGAFVAVSLPLVALSLLGNVQGIGFLFAQGYRIAADRVTVVTGVTSVVTALLCGHPANVARTGVTIVAGPDAGPAAARYWANIIAAVLTAGLAVAADPVTRFFAMLPPSYLLALTGLAIFSSLQAALQNAFDGRLPFGALVALIVAATPFTVAGIPSAFWSLLAGAAAAALAERASLRGYWQSDQDAGVPQPKAPDRLVADTVRGARVPAATGSELNASAQSVETIDRLPVDRFTDSHGWVAGRGGRMTP